MIRFLTIYCAVTLPASAAGELTWQQLPQLPDSLGVAGPFAGVAGGALVVAGGANFPDRMPWEGGKKVWHDKIWLLNEPAGQWREAGKLPRPLAYGVSVTTAGGIVCAGGIDATKHYSDVFRLFLRKDAISAEPLPPLPMTLAAACGAVVDKTLYVSCGAERPSEQAATNRTFALDFEAKPAAWRELPSLPGKPRLLATAASCQGAFYVIGGAVLEADSHGKIARTYLRETWRFRPTGGWQRMADLPKPNAAAPSPAPVSGGLIMVLAGDDGSRASLPPSPDHPGFPKSILVFDPASNRWTEKSETPAPRATVPCVEWRARFVIPSGEVRPGVRSPEVWSFFEPR